jgi:hypothetical protein
MSDDRTIKGKHRSATNLRKFGVGESKAELRDARNPDSQREATCSLVAGPREPTQPREGPIDCGLGLS